MQTCHFGCNQLATHHHPPTKKRKQEFWSCAGHQLSCPAVKERRKQTVMKEYGVTNILRLVDTEPAYASSKKARTDNYSGTRNFSKAGAPEAALKAQYEKYNVTNTAHIEGAIEKAKRTNLVRYGYEVPAHAKKQYQVSKKACEWLDSLAVHTREFLVPGTSFVADGYDPMTNTIYEYFGNYWHGNPRMYAADVFNDRCKKTMGQLYTESIQRVSKFESLGYHVVVKWEDEK